jgi:ferritin-like metal-binding protein YciE
MLAENLSDVFQRGLEFAYDGERQIAKSLAKLAEASSSPELKAIFQSQAQQAKANEKRLEKIFADLKRAPAGEPNKAVASVLDESEKLIKHIDRSALLDSALLVQGHLLAHAGIGLYGSLGAVATALKLNSVAESLQESLATLKQGIAHLDQIADKTYPAAVSVLNSPHGFAII